MILREERIGNQRLILGDCLQVMPLLGKVDAVVTDPPYDRTDYAWKYVDVQTLGLSELHGFWFWQANQAFPLKYTAHHIWSKCNVCVGDTEPYESIFEVCGGTYCGVFRNSVINCQMNAVINGDEYHPHPTQKPIKLMRRLVRRTKGAVLDPFMGSGTTLVACQRMGRHGIGIELDPDYFAIACKRVDEAARQPDLLIPETRAAPVQEQLL